MQVKCDCGATFQGADEKAQLERHMLTEHADSLPSDVRAVIQKLEAENASLRSEVELHRMMQKSLTQAAIAAPGGDSNAAPSGADLDAVVSEQKVRKRTQSKDKRKRNA
jgi:hypothetical protein